MKTYFGLGMTKDEISNFVHSNIGQTFAPDNSVMRALIENHVDSVEKLAHGLVGFRIVSNAIRPQYGECQIIRPDGSYEAFSYKKAFKTKPGSSGKLLGALREAIKYQTINAKRKLCGYCGASDRLEVDHINDFKFLVEEFLKLNDPSMVSFFENKKTNIFELTASDFKNAWLEFHLKTAKFQTLCKPCHLRKTHGLSKFYRSQRFQPVTRQPSRKLAAL
jgi:5-methylcytosine-specific restriction endonuclease McrA